MNKTGQKRERERERSGEIGWVVKIDQVETLRTIDKSFMILIKEIIPVIYCLWMEIISRHRDIIVIVKVNRKHLDL